MTSCGHLAMSSRSAYVIVARSESRCTLLEFNFKERMMSYSEHFFVPSNESSDAEVSEDHHQPTAAYGWDREPRYSAKELPSRVTNVEEEDASAAASDRRRRIAWPPDPRFVWDSNWCECGQKCIAMPSPRE